VNSNKPFSESASTATQFLGRYNVLGVLDEQLENCCLDGRQSDFLASYIDCRIASGKYGIPRDRDVVLGLPASCQLFRNVIELRQRTQTLPGCQPWVSFAQHLEPVRPN
jgi:hypothetical protein